MAEDREYKRLLNEKQKHKGEWLTKEAALEYQRRAQSMLDMDGQDSGMRRELRKEFQERYGILEIEAINILNGFYTSSYIDKYYRIRNLITPNTDSHNG